MLIAEDICKQGVTTSDAFNNEITKLIIEQQITRVVETGTYDGSGTTSAVLRGLLAMSQPFDFYSIEVSPDHYLKAKKLLGATKGLHLINGLSVGHSQKPVDITFNVPDHVVVDHQPGVRSNNYMKEVNFNVPDHQLNFALSRLDFRPELVILDSAGHMGTIEFRYLLERAKGSYYLALDDTGHVKHYENFEYIKKYPGRFEVIYHTSDKFGSAIIKVNEPHL